MKYWGKLGAFWGGLWGLLVGAAFFWLPGIGPLVVAGPVAAWIVGALEGAVVVGGLSVLGAGLYSIGIPKDSILEYETAVKADNFFSWSTGLQRRRQRPKKFWTKRSQPSWPSILWKLFRKRPKDI